MKILSKVLLSMAIGFSMVAVSSVASANVEAGRISYTPAQAIDLVVEKCLAAKALIDSGADKQEVYDAIKAALDASKEINANDKVDVARGRANAHLKKARSAAKKGDFQPAEEHLRMGIQAFEDLKKLL